MCTGGFGRRSLSRPTDLVLLSSTIVRGAPWGTATSAKAATSVLSALYQTNRTVARGEPWALARPHPSRFSGKAAPQLISMGKAAIRLPLRLIAV